MDKDKTIGKESIVRFCVECGEEIVEGQKFCASCGKGVNEKPLKLNKSKPNKKQIHILVKVGIPVIILILISFYMKEKLQQEARITYLTNIVDFHDEVLTAGKNLEDISDTVETYWKENIFEDKHGEGIDSAISKAVIAKNDDIENAKKYDKDILERYSNLKTVPKGSEDLESIVKHIDTMYNTYTDFYNFAIEPKGNFTEYSSANTNKTEKFVTDLTVLSNSIKSNNAFDEIKSSSEIIIEDMNEKMQKYKELDESIDKDLESASGDKDEKVKALITQFYGAEKSDISYITSESESFKNNALISNGIEIIKTSTEYLNNMIDYATQYEKTNSQEDLDKFKESMYEFKTRVALYQLNVNSLDDNKE